MLAAVEALKVFLISLYELGDHILVIRVSPCQRSLSFTCSILAYSKNRSSKIVVEHSLHVVTGQSLVQRARLLSSVSTSFPGFSPTSPYGVRERVCL